MIEKTNYFDTLNKNVKEVKIEENYFNNSTDFALLSITGLLDTYNSGEFTQSILGFINLVKPKVLVMNVSNVNYMSSTGIGSFVQINKECMSREIRLYVMGLQKNIQEVFSLLGFTQFFNHISELKDIKEEKIIRSKFPININCPYCNKTLVGKKIGLFKCPQCFNTFRIVDRDDKILVKKRS